MRPAFRTVIAVAVLAAGAAAVAAARGLVQDGVPGEGAAAEAAGAAAGPAVRGAAPERAARAGAAPRVVGGMLPGMEPAPEVPDLTDPRSPHSFYFARAAYNSYGRFRNFRGGRSRGSWATDFPKADLQFITVLQRLAKIDVYPGEYAITLDDPDIRRFPFLYALEVGAMSLTDAEVKGLRDYLFAGGFLVIDDFWGTEEWANFEYEIKRVLPEFDIVEMPLDHEIFHTYYDIEEILQVCARNNCRDGRTWERDGYVPHARGIFNDEGRLLVMINWNTDLGDAWEWAEQPDYPVPLSTYAFKMGLNFIIYAMSH